MIEYFEQILNQRNQKKDGNQDASLPNISQKDKKLIINKLFESSLLTDNDWRKFIIVFEKVHTGFFDRVNEKWTELTPSEIRLLALSRLEIDNKKMALMLGVGPDAIRQVKSRLRKKLTQNKAESFEALISSI
jgi:DNA-binding CsgD family transcriptional regulator